MSFQTKLISSKDLAADFGFSGPREQFYKFCRDIGVQPVPGRRGWFDPKLVRKRLDMVQGLEAEATVTQGGIDLVELRRVRRASK